MAGVRIDVAGRPILTNIPHDAPAFVRLAFEGDVQGFEEEMRKAHPGRLDINAGLEFYNRTPLHFAALLGKVEIVRCIVTHLRSLRPLDTGYAHEVVNAKDHFGFTPLHLAVRSNHEEVVRILTTSSWLLPDRFITATSGVDEVNQECEGYTPLHLAAKRGNVAIAKLLLRQSLCRGDYNAFDPVNIRATTRKGLTALNIAKRNRHKELVDLLECSDLSWLQSERDRYAHFINAVLVGGALIVAASFATWLQPPLGIPPDPIPDKITTLKLLLFFVLVAMSFASALAALLTGTVSIFPFQDASLKFEVEYLRSAVKTASCLLMIAVSCFNFAFMVASALVFGKVIYGKSVYSSVGRFIVYFMPVVCSGWATYLFRGHRKDSLKTRNTKM